MNHEGAKTRRFSKVVPQKNPGLHGFLAASAFVYLRAFVPLCLCAFVVDLWIFPHGRRLEDEPHPRRGYAAANE
jgi:hypothetical protein